MDFAMLKSAALCVALAFSAVAHAQTSVPGDTATAPDAGRFDQLDRNRDGMLSRDEANNAEELNTRFSELDRNNDNKLSREEYGVLRSERNAASGASAKTDTRGNPGAKGKTKQPSN